MSNLKPVTDETFEAEVLNAPGPVLVDFWATWCGPCRQVAPILEELAAQHGDKLAFRALDIDTNPAVPSRYRVTGVPTLAVFVGGELVKTVIGAKPKALLARELGEFTG